MSKFHKIKVSKIKKQTEDTVSVCFDIPSSLNEEFVYKSGQYLTLNFLINGKEERRAYSLSSSPYVDNLYEVAVKQVKNGIVSTYINKELKEGDIVDVMPPQGNFILEPNIENSKHYVAFAAGSGITPIISMIKTVVSQEQNSRFTLIYSNKTKDKTIFEKELESLKNNKFNIINIYTEEDTDDILTKGRITKEKAISILNKFGLTNADEFYICGPEEMIFSVEKSLEEIGVNKDNVNFELFTTPTLLASEENNNSFEGDAKIIVIYDDEETEFTLNSKGDTILDAAMENDVDVPFSCKGAVCCTCKAIVTKGKAVMTANYSLTEDEVEEGYILTCQAHPASEEVVVDFDEA